MLVLVVRASRSREVLLPPRDSVCVEERGRGKSVTIRLAAGRELFGRSGTGGSEPSRAEDLERARGKSEGKLRLWGLGRAELMDE